MNVERTGAAADGFMEFSVRKAYDGFSLDCSGEFGRGITAVFGPSGSGKTTLLDCVAGMLSPDEGDIRVGDALIYSSSGRVNVPADRRRFGYVFQDSALFPHMSVRRNIEYGYKLTPRSERRFEPDDLVELLSIGRLMERGVGNLSGGERQRVALARALAASPRLLLLDEPLASLDAAHRGSILTLLKRVSGELETPMIFRVALAVRGAGAGALHVRAGRGQGGGLWKHAGDNGASGGGADSGLRDAGEHPASRVARA